MRIAVKLLFRFATSSLRGSKRKVLIYGAGEMGFIVKRVLVSDPRGGFDVVGFIDDNRQLQGKKINGIPVFHPRVLTTDFSQHHKIETLIIAIRTLSLERKSNIIRKGMDAGLEILETPAIDKWLNGQLEIRQLQKVKLEDLLGRDPIKLDMDLIRKGLHKKTILVTGAAGSIGSEIVRQLSRFSMQKIILVDQAETPLFHIESELRRKFSHVSYKTILGDVCNYSKMECVFDKYHPEIVFHAAAYKHVPMMEENPHEALRVNIGGTQVITDLAIKYGVKKFVMISTDKSVNPTNLMGTSKHICELLVQSKTKLEGVKTQFVITRFGNVLGSNGSVIPIFKKQIMDGGPVTVTHPDITRYFMTIPEACELVLEAGFMGKGGEIFVFDMGEPVRILDLANNMIKLSGYEPGKDIKIEFVGLRPGEKLYEEILSDKENILPTHHKKIKIAQIEDYDYELIKTRISSALNNIYRLSDQDIVTLFEEIVPEYKMSKENNNNHLNKKHTSGKSESKVRLYEPK
jgi:FlaA1/EpsC-like NDP-sugar epimerase